MKTLTDLFQIIEKGGAGSGNLGHAGVPGHRGGSAPKGGAGGSSNPEMESFINSFKLEQDNKDLLDGKSYIKSQLNKKTLDSYRRHELEGNLIKTEKALLEMKPKLNEARKLVSPFKGQYEKVGAGEFSHPEGGKISVGYSSGYSMQRIPPSATIIIKLGEGKQYSKRWDGVTARDSYKKYLDDKFGIQM